MRIVSCVGVSSNVVKRVLRQRALRRRRRLFALCKMRVKKRAACEMRYLVLNTLILESSVMTCNP